MNTNSIKSFAKKARILLLDGVATRLKYWGFEADGTVQQEVQPTQGGYTFRGSVYTDATVPAKWNKLKNRLVDKQAVLDCVEEAAYTWFNRLMAIKILEKNGYVPELLGYANEMRTPRIVQNAKNGQHGLTRQSDINLLVEYLQDDKEDLAFALLITEFCNKNNVLHDVFGKIDDYTELLLPLNLIQKDGVLDLINSDAISDDDFREVELIGWLYQFYISDRKDQVFADFKKNKKARAEDIPAATQIFTPKWIVKYMVENTVGKIYLDYEPTSSLGSEMKYLVVNENDNEASLDTIGKKSIISDLKELTLIDPACGSGHILVTGFELLFSMYREEGYTAKQAVLAILENNLFGLDIDDRAMQLARFAVLLKSAKYDSEILTKSVLPHIYCFPEEVHFAVEELQLFLGADGHSFIAELKEALVLLNQGKNIGSALKISISEDAYAHVKEQFREWNEKALAGNLDIEVVGIWHRLQQHLEVLMVLGRKYSTVVANPPYMGQGNMNGELKQYILINYPSSKSDLYTVILERIYEMTVQKGKFALITPPSWMFTISYAKLRELLLHNCSIESLLNLGRGIFGADFGSCSFVFEKSALNQGKQSVFRSLFRGKSYVDSIETKETWFLTPEFNKYIISQNKFDKVPNYAFAYWIPNKAFECFENFSSLSENADAKVGLQTSDNDRFRRNWYEINFLKTSISNSTNSKWVPYNSGGEFRKWYGNQYYVINWKNDGSEIKNEKKSVVRNEQFYKKSCISWSKVTIGGLGFRFFQEGFIFDVAGCSIFTKTKEELMYFLGLMNSKLKDPFVYAINQSVNYEVGIINNFPIKFSNNNSDFSKIVNIVENNINLAKKDWDKNEISWNFESSILITESNIKKAFAKFQDYVRTSLITIYNNELELNKYFLNLYELNGISENVELKEITLYQDLISLDYSTFESAIDVFSNVEINKNEVISQFLSYSIGIFIGRYRLDKAGLNIAHPNPTDEELAGYQINDQIIEIDEDGIVPLMGENCAFPDDVLVRLKQMLLAVWGEETLIENINFLQECLGMDLHKWFTEKLWIFHTRMYKKKPIYWLFTSNPKKPQNAAFKVLVYMHRMDKYTVQKVQRNYLHPHQEYINQEIERLRSNELNLSKQELKRLETLMQWQLECRDYNEVLKELANQQIEFDLDDGVDVNYTKFHGAVAVI